MSVLDQPKVIAEAAQVNTSLARISELMQQAAVENDVVVAIRDRWAAAGQTQDVADLDTAFAAMLTVVVNTPAYRAMAARVPQT